MTLLSCHFYRMKIALLPIYSIGRFCGWINKVDWFDWIKNKIENKKKTSTSHTYKNSCYIMPKINLKKSVLAWLLAIKKKYYLSQSHWNIFISTECLLSSEIPPQYCCEIGKMLGVHYHSYAEKLYSILWVVLFIEFI